MRNRIISILSWLIVLWTAKVFLSSLPYKFSSHPDTQHIFGTIGTWMQGILGETIGNEFINYGAYAVGSVELIASIILLSPLLIGLLKRLNSNLNLPDRSIIHALGGLLSSGVMAGAVFFHLVTPLGIEVLHEGKSDNGSLFYAALSILLLGFFMFIINMVAWQSTRRQNND